MIEVDRHRRRRLAVHHRRGRNVGKAITVEIRHPDEVVHGLHVGLEHMLDPRATLRVDWRLEPRDPVTRPRLLGGRKHDVGPAVAVEVARRDERRPVRPAGGIGVRRPAAEQVAGVLEPHVVHDDVAVAVAIDVGGGEALAVGNRHGGPRPFLRCLLPEDEQLGAGGALAPVLVSPDDVDVTVAVEVRDLDVVQREAGRDDVRLPIGSAVPDRAVLADDRDDVGLPVAVDVGEFEVGADLGRAIDDALCPRRILVPDEAAAHPAAGEQVGPAVAVHIADALAPQM